MKGLKVVQKPHSFSTPQVKMKNMIERVYYIYESIFLLVELKIH